MASTTASASTQEDPTTITKLPIEILQEIGRHAMAIGGGCGRMRDLKTPAHSVLRLAAACKHFKDIFQSLYFEETTMTTINFRNFPNVAARQPTVGRVRLFPCLLQPSGDTYFDFPDRKILSLDVHRLIQHLRLDDFELSLLNHETASTVMNKSHTSTIDKAPYFPALRTLYITCQQFASAGAPDKMLPLDIDGIAIYKAYLPSEDLVRRVWVERLRYLPKLRSVKILRGSYKNSGFYVAELGRVRICPYDEASQYIDGTVRPKLNVAYGQMLEILAQHDQMVTTTISDLIRDRDSRR